LGLIGPAGSAIGQESKRIGDRYGLGAEGTIGRGTDILPGGPTARFESYADSAVMRPGVTYVRAGYAGVSSPPSTRPAVAPYLTAHTYTPGDGYRYPLYYNPATGTYFYYPVRR
jgi:hypothetical protein